MRGPSEGVVAGFNQLGGMIWAALGLTVVGWGMVWASGLFLITVVPVWLAVIVFFVGLALIPLCQASARRRE